MKKDFKLMQEFLVEFLRDEVYKTGLKKVVMGVSGGIDSAVVAVLAKEAFGDDLLGVMLPSHYSSDDSLGDALKLCEKFDIKYEVYSIEKLLLAYTDEKISKLRMGNLSARMRMVTLFDISARESALVLGTSNKTELLLGYGTLFGDLASAINPIGDIYKSDIFEFAEFLGVPEPICKKPPSADLWEGQSDEDDLGYTYAAIDEFLEDFIENRLSYQELLAKNYDKHLVDMVRGRIYHNQFKRKMPVIAKLTSRTIGHDFLYPRDIKL